MIVGAWEQQRKRDKIPKLKDFLEFLDAKARAQSYEVLPSASTSGEGVGINQRSQPSGGYQRVKQFGNNQTARPLFRSMRSGSQCPNCGQASHWLAACPNLLDKSFRERRRVLLSLGVCLNCLRFGHYRFKCERPGCRTKICSGDKHHIILCERGDASRQMPEPECKRAAMKRPRTQ